MSPALAVPSHCPHPVTLPPEYYPLYVAATRVTVSVCAHSLACVGRLQVLTLYMGSNHLYEASQVEPAPCKLKQFQLHKAGFGPGPLYIKD